MSHRFLHDPYVMRVEAYAKDERSETVWLTDAGGTLRRHSITRLTDLAEQWSGHIHSETVAAVTTELKRILATLDTDRVGK